VFVIEKGGLNSRLVLLLSVPYRRRNDLLALYMMDG